MTEAPRPPRRPRGALALAAAGLCGGLVLAALLALGVWQVHRLAWKHALVAQVAERLAAAPEPPPPAAAWAAMDTRAEQYRRLRLEGRFLNDRETLVQAVTELGPGFWVMTPLRLADDGGTVLVNRGFVPEDRRDPARRAAGTIAGATTVVGLLRPSEPGGGFLRRNDPAADRWYSRDVAAIAAARGLGPVAPFFVDADGTPNPGGLPGGGLTVTTFPDNHLSYALTWFALAFLLAGALAWVARDEWRLRQGTGS